MTRRSFAIHSRTTTSTEMLVTERNVSGVLELLSKHSRLVVDTETDGLFVWHGARIVGVSVATPGARRKECFYFPFRHLVGGNLSPQRRRQLMRVLATRKRWTCWNGKFDTHQILAEEGAGEPSRVENVDLLLHLLDENQHKKGGSFELKPSAERYLDRDARRAELRLKERLADLGLDKGDMDKLPPEEVDEYASDDVFYTEGMRSLMLPAAREWDLQQLWREVDQYSMITRRMEARGFRIDVETAERYIDECDRHMRRLKRKIDRMAGRELNLRSHPQMKEWLGLPSTAQDYIDAVEHNLTGEQRESVALLQEYRKWDRAKGSYYVPFLANIDSEHAYHPSIKLHGTISGRPSSSGTPNPFAIPRYTDHYKVKDVITARPGYTLISADYAQMELRFGAHYSGDEYLIRCFREGKSPHKLMLADLTAAGVDIDYDDTKRVNFAIMYGTGAPTLSKELRKPLSFAKDVLKKAHELHPNYKPMLKQAEDTARRFGFLRLWTGRVRHFNTLPDPQPWFHKACSNLIQGGVGEVMRIAICRLAASLDGMDAHMLLQVYDQILLECPKRDVKRVVKIVREEMTRDFPFNVPFVVDIKVGERWGQLKEMTA